MKKIKIIHLISSLTRGGKERQLATIVTHTNFATHAVKIVYFNDIKNSFIEEYGLQKYVLKIESKKTISRLKELNKILYEIKADVVYSWGNFESIFIILLKSFHSFVFINGSVRHGIRSFKFSHYFRTIILHLSPYVIANSAAGLRANNLKKGFVLYNGIADKFLEPLSNKSEKRGELINVTGDIPILISVANLLPYKDYATILKALKKLKQDSFNFHYIILGDGYMKDFIEKKINDFGLNENIKILGNIQNVDEFLKISNLFIHSSKGEGCSNAILEAMAAGLPVVASDTGGTSEIVTKENAFLFSYKDDLQLYKCIKKVFKNSNTAKAMGQESRKIIKEKYTVKHMMQNYESLVNQIISNG